MSKRASGSCSTAPELDMWRSGVGSERRDFRISTIGFVFQDFELLDYLDVLDNILLV